LIKGSYDYGFTSKSDGPLVNTKSASGGTVPASAFILGIEVFKENLKDIFQLFQSKAWKSTSNKQDDEVLAKLSQLKLSNEAIWKREESRPEVVAPWIIKVSSLQSTSLPSSLNDGDKLST
jgi:hypothetical protein